jgi:hypothetical protein
MEEVYLIKNDEIRAQLNKEKRKEVENSQKLLKDLSAKNTDLLK